MKFGSKQHHDRLNLGQKSFNIHTLGYKLFDNAYKRASYAPNANNSNGIVNDNNSAMSMREPVGVNLRNFTSKNKSNIERKRQ
jgi:hypothetical protein